MSKAKKGPPPIIGTCVACGTIFHSKYARKTHGCKVLQSVQYRDSSNRGAQNMKGQNNVK